MKSQLASAVVLLLLAPACVGGSGALSDPPNTYDKATITSEPPAAATGDGKAAPEAKADAKEPSSSGGTSARPDAGGGSTPSNPSGFVCSGTYSCTFTVSGKTQTTSVPLAKQGDDCVAGTGADAVVLGTDGIVKQGGESIGNWAPSAGGLSFTVAGVVTSCVR